MSANDTSRMPKRIIADDHWAAHQAAAEWLAQKQPNIPPLVMAGLVHAFELIAQFQQIQNTSKRLFRLLLIALRILPSSEKQRNADESKAADEPRKPRCKLSPAERAKRDSDLAIKKQKWHLDHAKKQRKKWKEAQKKLNALNKSNATGELDPPELDDDPAEPEIDPEEDRKAEEEFVSRVDLGGGFVDPSLRPPSEPLMRGGWTDVDEQSEECQVDRSQLPAGAVITDVKTVDRLRFDFDFSVTNLTIATETLFIKTGDETRAITANLQAYGPPRLKVTWGFLAKMSIMLSQFAMPMNRFAKLVSTRHKQFTAAEISRYYRHTAGYFLPIYLHLGTSLADAPVLCGDDTTGLVLEVKRGHEKIAQGKPPPWQAYATQEQARMSLQEARKTRKDIENFLARAVTPAEKEAARKIIAERPKVPKETLAMQVAAVFGFLAKRKTGKGNKTQFNTSVLSGRGVAEDPTSTIIFYRSHFGSMGNLLDVILLHRNPSNKNLVIQSDFSTTNLVSDPQTLSQFKIQLAGCASHARRPFAKHRDDAPDFCEPILHFFKAIPIYEHNIDLRGRNALNTVAVRDVDQRRNWEDIRGACEAIRRHWSPKTALGEGARYILNHYDGLTLYLKDARIDPSNNFSERMLRQEKLIRNNALFRDTLEGRCCLDIMRTVLQTALAAEVDPQAYLMWVMQTPQELVAANPSRFTPHAYALQIRADTDEVENGPAPKRRWRRWLPSKISKITCS